jgi:cellobiose phosphorylase
MAAHDLENPIPSAHRYGHFTKGGRAYCITDSNTPRPWVNVICPGRYGLVVSQNGGGFSWFDDAQHNVLTRWEMDLVRDATGKFLYLADLDTDRTWSLSPQPCTPSYDAYSCEHAQGRTTFETQAHGISARWTLTVSPDDAVELWAVEIRNNDSTPRRLRLSSWFEWCCNAAPDTKREFHKLFFDVSHDPARRAMVATKTMWDIRPRSEREHWNRPWPYAAAHAVCGDAFSADLAIADKELFLGRYGSPHAPAALRPDAARLTGGFGKFNDASAALGGDFTLAPGATFRCHYLIAIGCDTAEVLSLIDRHKDSAAPQRILARSDEFWRSLFAPTHVATQREDVDLLTNHWLPYQAVSGRLWGRTGYYQQSGAYGFRDQLQDSQVWLPLDPARTAAQIDLHARRQFKDGSVYHWWHALADFGNHTACSDDYLWLPFVTASYIRETGDTSILARQLPFVDDPAGATLHEHCRRSIARAFARTSARGLPFIGSCDWNDGLSAMGIDEKGESVWLAMFLCQVLADWTVIEARAGDADASRRYTQQRDAYAAAINAHAWDSEGYYKYGTKDDGSWVGASSEREGRIHLNPQTWSILTGIAPSSRADSAWENVKQTLLRPYGPLLLFPAYATPDETIGYITRYSPGSRENGGVYMHAATWCLAAACARRDVASAAAIWDSVSPPHRSRDADAYWAEPYVMPGNVDGPRSDTPGRAGWTWYTGSAAWLHRVCLEWLLGVRPSWEGLIIDPCPPATFGAVDITRRYRGVDVRVRFDAADYAPDALPSLKVNGESFEGTLIPAAFFETAKAGGLTVDITVSWTQSPIHADSPRAAREVQVKPSVATTPATKPARSRG